jgi:hypothetical protein
MRIELSNQCPVASPRTLILIICGSLRETARLRDARSRSSRTQTSSSLLPTQAHRAQIATEKLTQRGGTVDQLGGRTVGNGVRIAVRNDDDVTRLQRNLRHALESDHSFALGDEVIGNEPLGPGASTWATLCSGGTAKPHGAVHSA